MAATKEVTKTELDLLDFIRQGMLVPAIAVAAKLGIADLLRERPRGADELAAATGAHAPTLYRLLRTLAGVGLFEEDGAGRFALTRIGSALRTGEPARDLALFFSSPSVWAAWGSLEHSVFTGESAFRHANGMALFDFLEDHPEADALFHAWMTRQPESISPQSSPPTTSRSFGRSSTSAAAKVAYSRRSCVLIPRSTGSCTTFPTSSRRARW